MSTCRLQLRIESRRENIPLVEGTVRAVCAELGRAPDEASKAALCVVAAVSSSIEYAYGGQTGGEVAVEIATDGGRLFIEVADTGTALDVTTFDRAGQETIAAGPARPAGLPEGGRGLAIIKELMSEVAYASEAGVNRLRFSQGGGLRAAPTGGGDPR